MIHIHCVLAKNTLALRVCNCLIIDVNMHDIVHTYTCTIPCKQFLQYIVKLWMLSGVHALQTCSEKYQYYNIIILAPAFNSAIGVTSSP